MLIIAHRGASGYEPENTLRSFQKALDLKSKMIELDVYKCASGELVVMHDDKLDRTTNGKGYIVSKTYKELLKLDAGKGEKIPTLEEVFILVNRKTKINIELKGEDTALDTFELIKKYLKLGWKESDFLISSFNHVELLKFKKLSEGKIKIGACLDGILIDYANFAKKLGASSIHPSIDFITKEYVQDAHKRGLKVYVWTVNSKDDFKRMKKLKVDGIFTNYPDRF